MRAVVLRSFGGPEVLVPETMGDPVPPARWVVVALRAAALNWHDCLVRRGVHSVALPQVIGADGAGIRRDTGEEVMVLPSLFWGADDRFPAPEFEILGDHTAGTYAELVAVPEENVFPKPRGFDFAQAAALPLVGVTAYRALFRRGGLASGESVLILGTGGGVASTALALARIAGARVLVTSGSPAKLERAITLGAAGGALYTDPDWPVQVRELSGAGVDLVLDPVGRWQESLSVLAPGGRVVSLGANASESAAVAVRPFYLAQQSILGTTMGSARDLEQLLVLIARDPRWRPAIEEVFAFEDAASAHARMEGGTHFGKLVLSMV